MIALDQLTDTPLFPDAPREIMRDAGADVPLASSYTRIPRAALPFALLGLLIVIASMFSLQWPTAADGTPLVSGPFLERVQNKIGAVGIGGSLADLSLYLIVGVGLTLCAIIFIRRDRSALLGLVAVGVLGWAYLSGLVQYIGPMVAAIGFSLVLCAGLITFLAARLPIHDQIG